MPSKHTPNYGLNQWEKTDQVLMEDFNADNAATDKALKAEADARTALASQVALKADKTALTAETTARTTAVNTINTNLAKKGNCEIWTGSYTGSGNYGPSAPCKVTLSRAASFVLVYSSSPMGLLFLPGEGAYGVQLLSAAGAVTVSWSGTTVSWQSVNGPGIQMSEKNVKYSVVAFCKVA